MDPASLINLAIEIIQDYNPLRVTPSTQCDEFFKKKKIQDPDVQSFVKEIFFATDRYKKMLKIVVDGLFDLHASKVTRLDYTMYIVMTLVTVKKLHEMGFANFRKFILTQIPHKMHTLLTFLFSEENMKPGSWLEEQWALVYDIHFVQNNLIGKMQEVEIEMASLIDELAEEIKPGDTEETMQMRPKVFTTPQPFNLTPTSPKAEKPATPIYKPQFKYKPAPVTHTSLEQIERQKEERRQEMLAAVHGKYANQTGKFNLKTDERPSNIEKIREELLAEERRKFVPHKAKPVPKFKHTSSTIKRTAAQILRDESLYQRRAAEEAAKLREYEENLRDETEFMEWQTKMKAMDDETEKRMIEERRIAMAEASAKAQAACVAKVEENKEFVREMREESDLMLQEREKKMQEDMEFKREERERIQREKAHVAVVKAEMLEQKKEEALKAQQLREERAAEVKRQKENEMKKKKELIMQIQAMEKLAKARSRRPQEFDPSTASNIGSLQEMSLAELGERLNLLKIREEEERERKRKKILTQKQEKQDILDAMVRNHEKRREEANAARFEEHCSTKAAAALAAAKQRREMASKQKDFKQKEAAAHKAKRDRAIQLARELKAKRNAENFELSASGGRVDAKDAANAARAERLARDIEKGFARHEKQLAREKQEHEARERMYRDKDHRIRKRNMSKEKRRVSRLNKDYEATTTLHQAEADALRSAEQNRKNLYAKHTRKGEKAAIAKNKARNQYAADQTERALAIARAARARPGSGRRVRSAEGRRKTEGVMDLTQVMNRRPSSQETSRAAIDSVRFDSDVTPQPVAIA